MKLSQKLLGLFVGFSICLGAAFVFKDKLSLGHSALVPRKVNEAALLKKSKVEKVSDVPFILLVHDFVTDEEAEHLKEEAGPRLERSFVVGKSNLAVSKNRTSHSAFLTHESNIFDIIRERAANFVGTALEDVEALQVVHYQDGQRYDPHFDYFNRTKASGQDSIGDQGQRSATLLVYLNTIPEGVGGETFFPKVQGGLKIKPQKNMAVFWYNVQADGSEDTLTLHGGLPIHKGEKWASNIWIRNPKLKRDASPLPEDANDPN